MARTATVGDILNVMEIIAPTELAEEWDNVGLQVGSRQWPVTRLFTALDATPEVLQEVLRCKGSALVTHHPLIFRPLHVLDLDTALGGMLQGFIRKQIAVIAAHTNLDSVHGGVNDILAAVLEIDRPDVLLPAVGHANCGLGRVADLSSATTLGDLAVAVKSRMANPHARFVGDPQLPVHRVAICSGSGASLLEPFFASGAQVFITGDVRYHEAREVEARGLGMIDIGHYESEHIVIESLARQLADQFRSRGFDIVVEACKSEQAPFKPI